MTGAVAGAVGGILGKIGGSLLAKAAPKAMKVVGGLFGKGATEAGDAAATDATEEAASAAESQGAKTRSQSHSDEAGPAEESSGSCPRQRGVPLPHSFTGSTRVVMADGTTKAIDQIKVGDTIANSVPGVVGTEAHKVTDVIVTRTDHDFVDLTIKDTAKSTTKRSVKDGAKSLAKKAARKAAFGLAASAAVLGALSAGHGHGDAHEPATAPVAAVSATTHDAHLTTTFHHPFHDKTQSAFVEAKDLKPGDILQTPTGTTEVTGVRLYHAHTVTYDLTIGTLHTYYVEAGDTPVLVHNCDNEELQGVANEMAERATAYQAKSGSDWAVRNETTAVVRARFPVGDGTWKEANVVAHSGEGMSLEQIGMADELGDIPVETNFEGFTHAGHNALKMIDKLGGVPLAGGASRSVCSDLCAPFIRGTGGRISGAVYQLERGTKIRTFYWPGSRI